MSSWTRYVIGAINANGPDGDRGKSAGKGFGGNYGSRTVRHRCGVAGDRQPPLVVLGRHDDGSSTAASVTWPSARNSGRCSAEGRPPKGRTDPSPTRRRPGPQAPPDQSPASKPGAAASALRNSFGRWALLDVDLDYFTDAFRLVGEGRFSFWTSGRVPDTVLDEFEERAGRWIAMYRELSREQGERPQWLEIKLALTPASSFEDAEVAGEALADHLQLGQRPAESLRSAMEDRARILVLATDPPPGISGAVARVPGLSCVLVNRQDSEGRRNLDLARALFHLLTWDAMPPARKEPVKVPRRRKGWHVQRLAEHFASALLMPNGRPPGAAPEALPFGRPFVERIATALDAGRLSVKRTASLLDLPVPDLGLLLRGYGHEPQFEDPASPEPDSPGTPGSPRRAPSPSDLLGTPTAQNSSPSRLEPFAPAIRVSSAASPSRRGWPAVPSRRIWTSTGRNAGSSKRKDKSSATVSRRVR